MKRYLWGIEVRRLPRHPWEQYAVLSTRAVARRAAQNCRYPYRRIVKYVSER